MTGLNIGTRIRQHRQALNMSQEELAASCMCSRQTVSNWETDKTLPDVQSLKYLAAAFDTTADNLIADDGPEIARRVSADRRELQVLMAAELALVVCIIPLIVYDFLNPNDGVMWFLIVPALCEVAITVRETHLYRKHHLNTLFEVGDYIEGKQPKPRKLGAAASFYARHWIAFTFLEGIVFWIVVDALFAR